MADLYSYLPGIVVSDDEVSEAELITTQILQAKYPTLDLREGTGARDLTIRPAATLVAMIKKALDFYFVQNTLAGVNDNTPQEIVDKIMSNWFLTRLTGSRAVINARLFFARQKDLTIPGDTFFSPDNQLKYFPSTNLSVPNAQLTFDSNSNEYYYDLDITAEAEGTDYNISSGSLLYFSNFDPYFLHAEINYLKVASSATETNSQFIARAQTAISTRNLINIPSIVSNLLATFNLLEGVTPIGMGDPEMIRDQVFSYVPALSPPTVLIHQGGCVDIYSRVPLQSALVQYTADSSGNILIGGAVYSFTRSQLSGGALADTLLYYITKNVTSINRSSTTATVIATAHGFTTGDTITMIGAVPAGYNLTTTITVLDANTFTYTVPNTLTTPATGTITANKQTPFTTTNYYANTATLTSVTSVTTTATATLNNHGLTAGRWVQIAGATPTAYNGWYFVTATTANTFTYTFAGGTSPATGTITVTYTIPANDYGFSTRQLQQLAFGIGHAGQTASFVINYYQDLDGLQSYLQNQVQRVVCADLLARGYNMYLLDVSITGYNGPDPDPVVCTNVLEKYMKDLTAGSTFVMADVIAALSAAGIVTIKTPLAITYKYYNRDLIPPISGTITDYLDPADRTATFLLNSLVTNNVTV